MAKLFLRSGSLDAVLPLGENGQPVYQSALQLRETLRLRKQQQIADCLAIPQPNDAGDRLDWYSPVSGKITSWAAANDSARSHALNQLVACQQAVADMCQRAQKSEKNSQKLFGALLAKAIQFPDQNFVYLVGGKPILTFWGFVSLEKKNRQDPLDCLRAVDNDEPPLTLSKMTATVAPVVISAPEVAAAEPAAVVTPVEPPAVNVVVPADAVTYEALNPTSAPAPADPAPAPPESTPVEPPAKAANVKAKLLRYGWVLPTVVLLGIFGVQMKNLSSSDAPRQQSSPQPVAAPEPEKPVDTQAAAPPILPAPTLPVAPASVAALAQPAATQPAAENTRAASANDTAPTPAGKDDLVLPPDAVKRGSTRFLNGNWRVIVGIKTPLTGKPPILRYQLKNGKGLALMTQGDGTICRVDVFAGLMKSGNLVINSRTKARCSDGARYQMPELVCTQGATGAAACSGQYDADTVLPMTMKRESK